MFPKAHAAAYVTNAFRIAWFKVHQPLAYYAAYFSIRADEFDSDCMIFGKEKVKNKMKNIKMITLFHPYEKTPFMICIVNKVEDTEHGIKLTH